MAAIVIMPPVQFIADSPAIPKDVLKQAQLYQEQIKTQLNLTSPTLTVKQGGYKGTQVFAWNAKYDGIVVTFFVFEKGSGFKKEWVKIAGLIRKEDCILLGNTWEVGSQNKFSIPLKSNTETLAQISTRIFNATSPVKINLHGVFIDPQTHLVFSTVIEEEFAKNKNPTISNQEHLVCQANLFEQKTKEKKEVLKTNPQRLLEIQVMQTKSNTAALNFSYQAQMHSALFGVPLKLPLEKDSKVFDPVLISQNIREKSLPLIHDLKQEQFKIVRRFGSWVYLDKGRALGLKIGIRLVGPGKSKLHVIKYSPSFPEQIDASIAFIRHEDKDNPIKEGDLVQVDSSQ